MFEEVLVRQHPPPHAPGRVRVLELVGIEGAAGEQRDAGREQDQGSDGKEQHLATPDEGLYQPAPALNRPRREDAGLIAIAASLLFALAAWPLLLDLQPFQDLPNHVATAHIIAHPDLYPEYAFNGLLKSNALLTLWFQVAGGRDLFWAARVFTAVVLAAGAVALPLYLLHFRGR